MEQYLDMFELAKRMNLDDFEVVRRLACARRLIPPPLHAAAFDLLRWRQADVELWLYEQTQLIDVTRSRPSDFGSETYITAKFPYWRDEMADRPMLEASRRNLSCAPTFGAILRP